MAKIMVEVPDGPFCWKKSAVLPICQFFDNPAGLPE
ncbi:hypothetical protein LCGC14_2955300, partial [marine sediment metagenome]